MLTNKYSKWYFSIIKNAKTRALIGYRERHHILPKSLGGTNDSSNIVELSAKEHFICHLLLIRMTTGVEKRKMVYAAWQQSRSAKYKGVRITSRVYDKLRNQLSETYTGSKRAPFSDEAKANMKKAAANRRNPPVTSSRLERIREGVAKREKLTGEKNPFYGKKHTSEVSAILAEKNSRVFTGVPKTRVSCLYCQKDVSVNMLGRYHGINCKLFDELVGLVPSPDF